MANTDYHDALRKKLLHLPPEEVSESIVRLVQTKQYSTAEKMIRVAPNAVREFLQWKDVDGSTLLHMACADLEYDLADALLLAGADIHAKDDALNTPLHRLCQNQRIPHDAMMVRLLLRHGADPNMHNKAGMQPQHMTMNQMALAELQTWGAVIPGFKPPANYLPLPPTLSDMQVHSATAERFIANVAGKPLLPPSGYILNQLGVAVQTNRADDAERILSQWDFSEKINATEGMYSTFLHQACERAHAEVARVLLEHGANPNIPDSRKNFPIHTACKANNARLTAMLLYYGADPNRYDESGKKPQAHARSEVVLAHLQQWGAVIRDFTPPENFKPLLGPMTLEQKRSWFEAGAQKGDLPSRRQR